MVEFLIAQGADLKLRDQQFNSTAWDGLWKASSRRLLIYCRLRA
jgi:hypothetical protein